MEVGSIIIDTNAYAAFKRGDQKAFEIIEGSEIIYMSPIVSGELLAGFLLGSKEKKNRKEFLQFLDSEKVTQIDINNLTAEHFAAIFKELKQKGRPIPTNDIWIAALTRQYEASVFSFDGHFKFIDGLTVIPS